ncbi:shikimate kinase, partial [Blautia hydrogenotrophica]
TKDFAADEAAIQRGGAKVKNHIVIMGFNGSGKTRVGKRLAKDLNLPYLDVDKSIVSHMKMSVNEIYTKFGEPFFRALETREIKELIELDKPLVISIGAGLPIQEQNQKYLKDLGIVIYLKASVETLAKRLEGSSSFHAGENLPEKIKKLLAVRDPVYEKMSDIQVVTGVKPFEGLICEIKEKLENYQKTVEKIQ